MSKEEIRRPVKNTPQKRVLLKKQKIAELETDGKLWKEKTGILQKQLDTARREAERYRAEAELASRYRQEAWDLLVQFRAVMDHVAAQNRDYGKLCAKLYLDIQYALGLQRIGEDWQDQRQDLWQDLRRFLTVRCREDELAQLPDSFPPPMTWKPDSEADRMKAAAQEVFRADRAFRVLTEKLLILLEDGEAEKLPEVLSQCGIQVMFYADAPEANRDTAFFAFYDSGIEIPALIGLRSGDARLQVLARGIHVE